MPPDAAGQYDGIEHASSWMELAHPVSHRPMFMDGNRAGARFPIRKDDRTPARSVGKAVWSESNPSIPPVYSLALDHPRPNNVIWPDSWLCVGLKGR